jgi:GGDEF domain-containing protein
MQLALNINQAKILFSAMVGTALSFIAYLDFLSANYVAFLITATVAILLFINGLYLALRKQKHQSNYIIWLYMVLLAAFSLVISSQDQGQNIYWIYFYSISAMFLFPMKQALFLFFSYIPLALYIIFNFAPALEQPQVLFTFATIGTVAIFLAVVKSRTNKLLEPLISKELDTGAQKEKFLRLALSTEITRAEREGTGLTLMYFQLEPNYKAMKHSRLNFLQQVANAISATLRPFDQYYRVQQYGFAVILPHTTTKEAVAKAQGILSSIGHSQQDKNIQLGLSSLNVGDTSDTLIFAAKQALKYV